MLNETPKVNTRKTVSAHRLTKVPAYALVIFSLGLVCYGFFGNQTTPRIEAPGGAIRYTVADDDTERAQGLSGTKSLAGNTGKLFIFDRESKHGFWMKDMRYPIDIIWLDAAREVVHIKRSATPESFPEIFYPDQPALYVLEVNAGDAERLGIVGGVRLSW